MHTLCHRQLPLLATCVSSLASLCCDGCSSLGCSSLGCKHSSSASCSAGAKSDGVIKAAAQHDVRHCLDATSSAAPPRASTHMFSIRRRYGGLEAQLQVFVEPLAEENEGISVLSLNRSAARNALGRQLVSELQQCLAMLRQEHTTRCLLVRSLVPGVFCAGADLKERATMTQQETAEFVGSLRSTFATLSSLPMPTIAVVEGVALGGGAELALACDLRVGDAQAVLAFPETRLGIIPGAGGTQRLPRLVGEPLAKELIFTGRRVGWEEALRMRLLDHVAPPGAETGQSQGQATGLARALALARDIARGAPLALRLAKAAVSQGMDVDLNTGLKLEDAFYAQIIPTQDRLEGLRAFAEKRMPVFVGH